MLASIVPLIFTIRGVVSLVDPSAFTSWARVLTVKVCAASAFAPPVVPVPEEAQPSLAASVWWYRSTVAVVLAAFALSTRICGADARGGGGRGDDDGAALAEGAAVGGSG